MQKHSFLNNLVFLLFANVLVKPLYLFGVDRGIQNAVPEGHYGFYFELFAFTFLFQIINDFGIQNYNNRQVAQHEHLLPKYFPTLLLTKLLLGVVYFVVLLLGALAIGYAIQVWPLLLLIGLQQFLAALVLFLRSNISGLGWYRTDGLLSILDKLLMISLLGPMLIQGMPMRIEYLVYGLVGSYAITALVAWILLWPKLKGRLQWRWRWPLSLAILRQSYPFALVVLLMSLYTRIDAIMLGRMWAEGAYVEAMAAVSQTDYYAAAYRLLDAANMVGFLLASLLLPMFSRLLRAKKTVAELALEARQTVWAIAIPVTVLIWYYQEPLMRALYDFGDQYAGQVLGVLFLGFPAICGSYIYGTLLTAEGNLKKLNILLLGGLLLNVMLNLMLIPAYAAVGAAVATVVTQWLVFAGQYVIAKYRLELPVSLVAWLRILLFAGVVGIWGYIAQKWPMAWYFQAILAGVGMAFTGLLFGLVRLKSLKEKVA